MRHSPLLVFIFLLNAAYAQTFVLQGRLLNCPERTLVCYYKNAFQNELSDTIRLDPSGRFRLVTKKVSTPLIVNIRANNIQLNGIFVAPGFDLNITGNASDFLSLYKTATISGAGAESNQYLLKLRDLEIQELSEKSPYDLEEKEFRKYITHWQKVKDSLTAIVFNKPGPGKTFFSVFKDMVQYDTRFSGIGQAISYARLHRYDFKRTGALLESLFDKEILVIHPGSEKFLISYEFRNLVTSTYLTYRLSEDYDADTSLRNRRYFVYDKIVSIYTGGVRKYALKTIITDKILYATTVEELNMVKAVSSPFVNNYLGKEDQEAISRKYEMLILKLNLHLAGKPATDFCLPDSTGRQYSLKDFKGKVIYIDLWASWCAPCRAETPSLNALVKKYSTDNRLVVISIAVSDGKREWLKAIRQDQPDWLQLIDADELVYHAYMAYTIPKFILIDKQGRIVKADAPRPGEADAISLLIEQEINR